MRSKVKPVELNSIAKHNQTVKLYGYNSTGSIAILAFDFIQCPLIVADDVCRLSSTMSVDHFFFKKATLLNN